MRRFTLKDVMSLGSRLSLILLLKQEARLDASHIRHRAFRAREMAQAEDDFRLSQMLLKVAEDLEAEANAMEAEGQERRAFPRLRQIEMFGTLFSGTAPGSHEALVQITDLSVGGAKIGLGGNAEPPPGNVVLALPGLGLFLKGTILRTRGAKAAMMFDSTTNADLCLKWFLSEPTMTGAAI